MKAGEAMLAVGRQRQIMGMTLAVTAYLLLAMQDATVKWLVQTIPVWQILFVRSAMVVMGCLLGGGRPLLRRAVATPARPLLLRRGAITLIAWFCFFTAARDLPLGELVTLWFTAPVIVALLAGPMLGERVSGTRWLAIATGFVGTLLVANPAGMAISRSAVLVLTGAIAWGYGMILTRQIARQESSLLQMLFNNTFFLVVTGIGSTVTWHSPTVPELLFLAIVAVFGGFGQFSLFESVRRAPASLIAPLEYTALLWAFVIGFVVWGDIPGPPVLLGASLILAAGLILVMAERRGSYARNGSRTFSKAGASD
jgi:drug/metabolite transporter (DMT)-like permease